METGKKINALRNFIAAWSQLSEEFDNDTMKKDYPFDKCFNELKTDVSNWVDKSIESILEIDKRNKYEMFKASMVKMTPSQAENHLGYNKGQLENDIAVYIFMDRFYLTLTKNLEYHVGFSNKSDIFERREDAMLYLFVGYAFFEMQNQLGTKQK